MSWEWRVECEDCAELCVVGNEYSKDEPEACPYCSSSSIIVELVDASSDEEFEEDEE